MRMRGTTEKPIFKVTDNTFTMILPNCNYKSDNKEKKEEHRRIDHLSDQEKVTVYAQSHESFTRKDIQSVLEVSQATCNRLLKNLVEQGILIQIGKGKNTRYQLAY